ncbi:hypothetical protein JW905_09955 [bacterium]|nr:hypothetical protein [candidate division CSSED10-310 bacterium]
MRLVVVMAVLIASLLAGLPVFTAEEPGPAPAAAVMMDVTDPAGDDTGDGDYTYPTNAAFAGGGMADMLAFKMFYDQTTITFKVTFKNLVDPWNYGNRLTYLAIAVDTAEGGGGELGNMANARLHRSAEFVVYAGGNEAEVWDLRTGNGKKVKNAGAICFGDSATEEMTIMVPVAVLGTPASGWHLAVAAGIQEDFGAGGLGVFRDVDADAKEWRGGGGNDLGINPNIYDLLVAEDVDQAAVLGEYSLDAGTCASIPYVKVP